MILKDEIQFAMTFSYHSSRLSSAGHHVWLLLLLLGSFPPNPRFPSGRGNPVFHTQSRKILIRSYPSVCFRFCPNFIIIFGHISMVVSHSQISWSKQFLRKWPTTITTWLAARYSISEIICHGEIMLSPRIKPATLFDIIKVKFQHFQISLVEEDLLCSPVH